MFYVIRKIRSSGISQYHKILQNERADPWVTLDDADHFETIEGVTHAFKSLCGYHKAGNRAKLQLIEVEDNMNMKFIDEKSIEE